MLAVKWCSFTIARYPLLMWWLLLFCLSLLLVVMLILLRLLLSSPGLLVTSVVTVDIVVICSCNWLQLDTYTCKMNVRLSDWFIWNIFYSNRKKRRLIGCSKRRRRRRRRQSDLRLWVVWWVSVKCHPLIEITHEQHETLCLLFTRSIENYNWNVLTQMSTNESQQYKRRWLQLNGRMVNEEEEEEEEEGERKRKMILTAARAHKRLKVGMNCKTRLIRLALWSQCVMCVNCMQFGELVNWWIGGVCGGVNASDAAKRKGENEKTRGKEE